MPRFPEQTKKTVSVAATRDADYLSWIGELKKRYRATQIKAAISVNSALIEFYWNLGRDIAEKYPGRRRGLAFFENLSADLQLGIDNPKGLSPRNLKYALAFYELYGKRQQLVADNGEAGEMRALLVSVPWGHHVLLFGKCGKNVGKALFYVVRTIRNGWSRNQLAEQIEARLYEKSGKTIDNFRAVLPSPESKLVRELVKSEYSFDLMETVDEEDEREIEKALVRNIARTLTELGGGFAYIGRQVRVTVGGKDFWPDLVFYHLALRRYLVVELKVGEFQPEHTGQLGFYMTAVDRQLRHEWDGRTIGLLLCQRRNRTIVEYALADESRPMGVAQYTLTQSPPDELSVLRPVVERLGQVVDATLADIDQSPPPPAPPARPTRR